MRGYTEIGKLVNEAIVAEKAKHRCIGSPLQYRAELRIAGHGTFLGEWHDVRGLADDDLAELQAKHQPSKPNNDGISPKQHEDFAAALHESASQTARRELGHGFNMAYEG